MEITCPRCECKNMERQRVVKKLVFGDVEVTIGTPLHCCNDCGEEFWVSGIDPDFMAIALSIAKEFV